MRRMNDSTPMITRGSSPTLCPDCGTAERSCTPSRVPRASQAPIHRIPHPLCPGGSTSGPRARANTCAPPCRRRRPQVSCPHVLGPGWRLPGSHSTP
eukprot:scaffold1142_cov36-Phaeocystis_antarctica.AAC.1